MVVEAALRGSQHELSVYPPMFVAITTACGVIVATTCVASKHRLRACWQQKVTLFSLRLPSSRSRCHIPPVIAGLTVTMHISKLVLMLPSTSSASALLAHTAPFTSTAYLFTFMCGLWLPSALLRGNVEKSWWSVRGVTCGLCRGFRANQPAVCTACCRVLHSRSCSVLVRTASCARSGTMVVRGRGTPSRVPCYGWRCHLACSCPFAPEPLRRRKESVGA